MFVSMTKRCLMAAAIAAFFSVPLLAMQMTVAQAQSGIGGISTSAVGESRRGIRSSRKHGLRAGRNGKRGFGGRHAGRFASGQGWFHGRRWFGGRRSTGGRIGVAGNMTARPQRPSIRHDAGRGAHAALKGYPLSRSYPVAYVTEEYILDAGVAPVAPVGRLNVSPVHRAIRLPRAKRIRHWSKAGGASSRVRYWRPAR